MSHDGDSHHAVDDNHGSESDHPSDGADDTSPGTPAVADGTSNGEPAEVDGATDLRSLRFVGPATEAALTEAGYDASAITDKRVSYRMLVRMSVNPGVAAKIRRKYSLSWSFRSGGDLTRRSAQVRGLGSAEAAWVAASAGDWDASPRDAPAAKPTAEAGTESSEQGSTSVFGSPWPNQRDSTAETETDGSGDALAAEAAWRARSKPTPLTDLDGLDETAVELLAEAGINTVRSLSTANLSHLADVLQVDPKTLAEWHQIAQDEGGA